MRLHSALTVARLTNKRALDKIKQGQLPGPELSTAKLALTNNQTARRQPHRSRARAPASPPTRASGARSPGRSSSSASPACAWPAGTDEVMKNIVAERVLGLPKDPGIDSKTAVPGAAHEPEARRPRFARRPAARRPTSQTRVMRLTFIRHGEPAWTVGGRSVDDPVLTERGQRQAALLARHLADLACDEVLVSPLVRARETAAPLLAVLGHEPEEAAWLEEIRAPPGAAHRRSRSPHFAEGRARPVEEQWDGIPGGESFRDFHVRVTGGLTDALRERGARPVGPGSPLWEIDAPGHHLVLVAHAGTNAVAIGTCSASTPCRGSGSAS
jgi:probable phosphoglycerate mutase